LFLVVAVQLVGFGAGLAVPTWSQPFAHAYPKLFLFLTQLAYVALSVAALAVTFGAVLGRVIRSRALSVGLLCAAPWLLQVSWSEFTGPSMLFSSQWFVALPILVAVVSGLVLGVLFFGGTSDSNNRFQDDAFKAPRA